MNSLVKVFEKTVPAVINTVNLENIGWPGVAVIGIIGLVSVANHAIDEKAKVRLEVDPENNRYRFEVN